MTYVASESLYLREWWIISLSSHDIYTGYPFLGKLWVNSITTWLLWHHLLKLRSKNVNKFMSKNKKKKKKKKKNLKLRSKNVNKFMSKNK